MTRARISPYLLGAAAFFLGAAGIFAFAPFRLWAVSFAAVAGLIGLTLYDSRRAVRYAYLWGLGFFLAHSYWINTALYVFGAIPLYFSLPLTLTLPLYLACYPMLAVWLTRRFALPSPLREVLILPPVWTVLEYGREHFLMGGFGWGTLGYAQAVSSPLIGFGLLGGVLLVTYAVVFTAALLVYLALSPHRPQRIAALLTLFALFVTGQFIYSLNFTHPDGTRARVGIAQINVAQDIKFDLETIRASVLNLQNIIAGSENLDILFFPETSIPLSWENLAPEEQQKFITLSRERGTAVALGMFKESSVPEDYYNAIIGLNPESSKDAPLISFYAKRHLVPFGEYKPFPFLTERLFASLNLGLGEVERGKKEQRPMLLGGQQIAFNICYEESFGDELIHAAKNASLIANETNMAWYGSSYAMDLQLQQGQMRAVELGRYVVRATNTGYSAILNNKGQIMGQLPRDRYGVLVGEIRGFRGETPYMRLHGAAPWIFTLSLLLVIIWLSLSRKERKMSCLRSKPF